MTTTPFTHPLDTLPPGAVPHSVTATPTTIDQRPALRVSLTDQVTLNGTPGIDYIDQPTFLVLPVQFTDGTIEVDLRSRLNHHAPDYARGFAGIAYRISPDADRFEAAYLRPLNGLRTNPHPRETGAPSNTSPTPTGPSTDSATPTPTDATKPPRTSAPTSGSTSVSTSTTDTASSPSTPSPSWPSKPAPPTPHPAPSACSSTSAPKRSSPT